MRGVDVYYAVNKYFIDKNVTLEKLASVTTDGAPAMTGRHTGFVALCRLSPDFPKFLHYHCIIHQQAMCAKVMGFDHVMTSVVKKKFISVQSNGKQYRSFKVLVEEFSAEYGDLLLHTERGRILQRFSALLSEIQGVHGIQREGHLHA